MYDGMASNLQATVANFFRIFAYFMLHRSEYQELGVIAEIVYESFRHTAATPGATDGWCPRELAYFSLAACRMVAHLFNLIEEAAPWPNSTRAARVVLL